MQTAEFFTFEIAKLLAGVLHNTGNIIYQIVMVYTFTRTCSRFNNAKIYVDWRFVNKIKHIIRYKLSTMLFYSYTGVFMITLITHKI